MACSIKPNFETTIDENIRRRAQIVCADYLSGSLEAIQGLTVHLLLIESRLKQRKISDGSITSSS